MKMLSDFKAKLWYSRIHIHMYRTHRHAHPYTHTYTHVRTYNTRTETSLIHCLLCVLQYQFCFSQFWTKRKFFPRYYLVFVVR